LLARHDGDLPAFYRAVAAVAGEPRAMREQRLTALAHGAAAIARD
jgi:predicted aminopeptidase